MIIITNKIRKARLTSLTLNPLFFLPSFLSNRNKKYE